MLEDSKIVVLVRNARRKMPQTAGAGYDSRSKRRARWNRCVDKE